MKSVALTAFSRTLARRGGVKKLRDGGRIPAVIYGAGPRTVLESHAKRADERLDLEDLRRATKVVARTLRDLLA